MNVANAQKTHTGSGSPLLCAVDRSIEAREAADVAAGLAAQVEASLLLVHVLPDPPTFWHRSEAGRERQRVKEADQAQHLLERIASDSAPDRETRVRVAVGEPAKKVMALADEEDAQMVVVGSHGRGAIKAAVLGSVSSRLAAHPARPVVVVPPGGLREFRLSISERAPSVVCGVDGSDTGELAARHAAHLAARLGMRLVLVHVYRDRSRALHPATSGALPHHGAVALETERRVAEEVLDRAAQVVGSDLEVSLKLESGDPASMMERRAGRECAALIVTGSRGRGALASAVLGSVSKRLAASADRPVMLVASETGEPEAQWAASASSRGPTAA